MTRSRSILVVLVAAVLVGAIAYLHDPPWLDRVTNGMRDWEEDPPGTRFRWAGWYGSFFVPSDATSMTLPLRVGVEAPIPVPVVVAISVDGRWLATVTLTDPREWRKVDLPLPRRSSRRFRRVDLSVNRSLPPYNLGVMVGEPIMHR